MKFCIPKACALLLLFLFVANSHACKPAKEAYDLDAFLALDRPRVRIFEAQVLKVRELKRTDGLREQEVTLRVDKDWLGASHGAIVESAVVSAVSRVMAGTSCAGTFDVEMREGEQWIVVALPADEKLIVKPMLSERFSSTESLSAKRKIIENFTREKKIHELK